MKTNAKQASNDKKREIEALFLMQDRPISRFCCCKTRSSTSSTHPRSS